MTQQGGIKIKRGEKEGRREVKMRTINRTGREGNGYLRTYHILVLEVANFVFLWLYLWYTLSVSEY
jgi:hypothetical protein